MKEVDVMGMFQALKEKGETKLSDHIMDKKEEPKAKKETGKSVKSETKAEEAVEAKSETKERKAPQMVTVNGDKVTHAHVYKSNKSDDFFFTAKLNDVPLKPQKVSTEDMDAVIHKTKSVEELMRTYYPTKLMPKLEMSAFKLPAEIITPEGPQQIHKFNVYKDNNPDSPYNGKYMFYTQVGDKKMSYVGTPETLNAYFDRVQTPAQMVARVFGERLHLAEHYQGFKLPEGAEVTAVHLSKNKDTNRYEISATLGDRGRTPAKEISYDDRQSVFNFKTATKEQLAAKYLAPEIKGMMEMAPEKKEAVKQTQAPSLKL